MQQMTHAEEAAFVRAVADEMSDLADRLCKLACVLARDPDLIVNYLDDLQAIDLMTQTQRALADVLREPGEPNSRINRIPVQALADRLAARIDTRQDQAA